VASWNPDDRTLCVVCGCPRWEHWSERLTTDWDLLAYSNACDEFHWPESRARRFVKFLTAFFVLLVGIVLYMAVIPELLIRVVT